MSNTNINSCGPINCQLARAKKYIQLGTPTSYCHLQQCDENFPDDSSKSPLELKQQIEYCEPTNCATFWDSFSENNSGSVRKKSIGLTGNAFVIEESALFNYPQCAKSRCPKQTSESSLLNEESHLGEIRDTENIQIKLCGPPDCCTIFQSNLVTNKSYESKKDVDLNKLRNPIFYCVSPSVAKELQLPTEPTQLITSEKIITASNKKTCPHTMCCSNISSGSKSSASQQNSKSSNTSEEKIETSDDISRHFHKFDSMQYEACIRTVKPQELEINQEEENARISLNTNNIRDLKGVPKATQGDIKQAHSPPEVFSPPEEDSLKSEVTNNNSEYQDKYDEQETSPPFLGQVKQNLQSSDEQEEVFSHIQDVAYKIRKRGCISCCKKDQAVNDKIESDPCSPRNCKKLLGINGRQKWKSCCNSKLCPTNDPTSSTYNFLLKMRMCCRTRQCQLAAKICDIYEPLVKVDTDLSDIGDPQYHYLSQDSATLVTSDDLEAHTRETSKTTQLVEIDFQNQVESNIEDIMVEEISSSNGVSKKQSGEAISARRVSTVSWSVPNVDQTKSEEEIITHVTTETEKFRQTPNILHRGSVFGDVIRKSLLSDEGSVNKETPGNLKPRMSSLQKNVDSNHKQKCYPSLRKKFQRKKKKTSPEEDTATNWQYSASEYEDKRKTLNINIMPVQEKDQQINNMLHKI